jgi:cytochrome b561
MQWGNSKFGYGALPQALHWLTAICVIVAWLLGQLIDAFPKGPPRVWALWTHMTVGECVMLFLIVRLVWRIADPPPPLERTRFGRALEIASKLSHYAMYALLLAVPCLGIIVRLKHDSSLPIFGAVVASPWPADRATAHSLLEIHELLANALLILAGIHAAAALMHHYVWRDRTLVRMLPGATPSSAGLISAVADKLR